MSEGCLGIVSMLGFLLIACMVLVSCASGGQGGEPFAPRSYTYILQADAISENHEKAVDLLAGLDRDLFILDRNFSAREGGEWGRGDLARMRSARKGRKILCYFSIGEAEKYRSYWSVTWLEPESGKRTQDAPDFLLDENPDWKGNYRVKFWSAAWQKMVLRDLDDIVDIGFDGVMLDIVDAFEYFEKDGDKYIDDRKNPETGNTYRADMIKFILKIEAYARRKNPLFMVFPQNGAQLLADKAFRDSINGVALESLFCSDKEVQGEDHREYITGFLELITKEGKPVLVTEYPDGEAARKAVIRGARAHPEYSVLITGRALNSVGEAVASGK